MCMYVRMHTCMCVCVHHIACWVRLSCGAGVDFAAPFSCVRAQTHTHEEGRGKERKEERGRETGRQAGARKELGRRYEGDIKEKSGAARLCLLWRWRTRPQRITRALDRRRSLMRSRQRRARRARTPSSSRTSRPPPPLPWRRSLSSPTPPAPTTTSRLPPRCVCVCVLVCLCAGAGARVRNHGRSGRDKCGVSSCWLVHDRQCRMLWRGREQTDWRG